MSMNGSWNIPGYPDGRSARYAVMLLFLLLFTEGYTTAAEIFTGTQDPDSLLVFRFLQEEVELPDPGTTFNVLEIINNHDQPIEGVVRIGGPEGWRFIGPTEDTIALPPGGSRLIPVRVSIPRNTVGGVSFVIGAELFGKDLYDYTNAYISIERKTRWDMRLSTGRVFISDFRPYGEFLVTLDNSGNSNEMVKLSFELGGLLEFRDPPEADSFLYVDLPAYGDTTLRFEIRRRTDLRYSREQALEGRWRSTSVGMQASTPERSRYGSVSAIPLVSNTVNDLPARSSPLNAEVTVYNLLSQQRKKMSARVYGKVLFPKAQQVAYSLGYYNLYFDPEMNRGLDLYQQLRYMVRYNDPGSEVWMGDRLGVGELHTLTGRGVRAFHRLNEQHTVYLNVIQNPYARNIGGFAGYGGYYRNISWQTGV
ncbi:MAG: hypothetical protein EHM46_03395, partial [Bacteroidetes bacterium]